MSSAHQSGEVIWHPRVDALDATRMGRFAVRQGFSNYRDLHEWSVRDLPGFWHAVVTDLGVKWRDRPMAVLPDEQRTMPGANWFPGSTLNYAEHALARAEVAPHETAVISRSQTRPATRLTWRQLHDDVARVAAHLRLRGVQPGDRVAAYAPNIAETLIAFLAAASIGAVWSSCSPEFGERGVFDRLVQIRPKVLLTIDGYRYGDRSIDRRAVADNIASTLPDLQHVIAIPYLGVGEDGWSPLTTGAAPPLPFASVAFDHPLYVLFSSGTTGIPKPIVHGHGGILVEHLKALSLHHDLGPGERFFWFTTTGWMMWNYLVSGLVTGSSIVLFDGDPGHGGLDQLWKAVDDTEATVFGVGAPFIAACAKQEIDLPQHERLRQVGSTGAPLTETSAQWLHDRMGASVQINSISGGTDVCTAFVGANPLSEVRAGEISGAMLGCAVEAFADDGRICAPGELGELVITEPMPSMPVGFWADDLQRSRYRAAYYSRFPGVWAHGDWITFFDDGSCEITGRSDATLNRGGVRLGTADFYDVVESLPEIDDSLVVHVQEGDRLLLFVKLHSGSALDEGLRRRITSRLRSDLSPRHAPDEIVAAPALPRTLSGKKLEVPVKRILNGESAAVVTNLGSVTDPEGLDWFERWRST
jgi:acetoacetyl-CoA synthetase